jgi:hypothetical protein
MVASGRGTYLISDLEAVLKISVFRKVPHALSNVAIV